MTRKSQEIQMPKTHILKCVNPYFQELIDGNKTFELRQNDRDYQLGDVLILKEYFPETDNYSGRDHSLSVDYIIWNHRGLNINYIVMSENKDNFDIHLSDEYEIHSEIMDSSGNDREISYILDYQDFPEGIEENYCIISYK
jgi:hypothetical protein